MTNKLLNKISSLRSASFGDILISILKSLSLSQKDLATLLDTSPSSVNTWVKRDSNPRPATIRSIETVLNEQFKEKFNHTFIFFLDFENDNKWGIKIRGSKSDELRELHKKFFGNNVDESYLDSIVPDDDESAGHIVAYLKGSKILRNKTDFSASSLLSDLESFYKILLKDHNPYISNIVYRGLGMIDDLKGNYQELIQEYGKDER